MPLLFRSLEEDEILNDERIYFWNVRKKMTIAELLRFFKNLTRNLTTKIYSNF